MQLLNNRQIADLVRRPFETTRMVIDRLRSWADYGLLEPVGEKHPGTGKARRYGLATAVDAIVLTALTDVGLAAVRFGHFRSKDGRSLLQMGRQGFCDVANSENVAESRPWFLIVVPTPAGTQEPVGIALLQSGPSFERPDENGIEGRAIPNVVLPTAIPGAIVLNLTEHFRALQRVAKGVWNDETRSADITLIGETESDDGEH
jgi:hypothetical protein